MCFVFSRYVCVCVCVYAFVLACVRSHSCVSVHVPWHACGCEKKIWSVCSHLPPCLTQGLSAVHWCGYQSSWPTNFQGFSCFTSHLGGITAVWFHTQFYLVYGVSNSGLHTHSASTLPTEPSPKNLDYYKKNELIVNL